MDRAVLIPRAALVVYVQPSKSILPMQEQPSVFATLNAVNCNEHTEKKGNLTYLSWAWAWQIVKSHFPDATYTIYESPDGWNYFTDGRTCWVKTGVTIRGLEHIEYLPVMDQRNQSIPFESVRSTDVNKAIQRSLTKACARHGLGLYIYAGEDLPDSQQQAVQQPVQYPAQYPQSQQAPVQRQQGWRQARSQYYAGQQQPQ
jgi:hypothetical protein